MLFLPPYLVVGQLLHLDDVVQVEVHKRRDQVAGIIIMQTMMNILKKANMVVAKMRNIERKLTHRKIPLCLPMV